MTSIIMWTEAYRPFVMGGDVAAPIGVEVEAHGKPHDIGGGFFAYVIVCPDGNTAIVEEQSGGIVGRSLEQVRSDVAGADAETMRLQVAKAMRRREKVDVLSPDEFFGLWK